MLPTLGEIAELTGGQLSGLAPGLRPGGLGTDSRDLHAGDLFLALRGEKHDGHDYVAAALAAGALAAVVSRRPREVAEEAPLLLVEDPLVAYGRLGQWRRGQSAVRVVAVTGSTGKTSTKNLLGGVLAQVAPTLVAPGNENNEVGVPRTLLRLQPEHRFAVLELGMRGRGEVAYLAELAAPEVGVITNIGASHLGRLGSREAIAESKAELLAALPGSGRAVLNADDFFFPLLSQMAPCPVVAFGLEQPALVRAEDLELLGLQGSRFTLCLGEERVAVTLPLAGRHQVLNALAAAAAAWALTGSSAGVVEGLAAAQGEELRGEVLTLPGPLTVINDAYNASPTSVAAALDLLCTLDGRRVLVLGDMLELGDFAEEEHRKIGDLAAARGVALMVAVGPAAGLAAAAAAAHGLDAEAVDTPEQAVARLREGLRPGDVVLVKGSRGMALERVVEGLCHDR